MRTDFTCFGSDRNILFDFQAALTNIHLYVEKENIDKENHRLFLGELFNTKYYYTISKLKGGSYEEHLELYLKWDDRRAHFRIKIETALTKIDKDIVYNDLH